jgi:hypothetical protein
MYRSFGLARSSAREMKQREVFRVSRPDRKIIVRISHQLIEVSCAGHCGQVLIISDEEDVLERWQRSMNRSYFSLVKRLGSHQDFGLAYAQSRFDRLRTEGRE